MLIRCYECLLLQCYYLIYYSFYNSDTTADNFRSPHIFFQWYVSHVSYMTVSYFAELVSHVCSHQALNYATRRTDTCSTGLIEIPADRSKSMGKVVMHRKRNKLRSPKDQHKNGTLPSRDISSTDAYNVRYLRVWIHDGHVFFFNSLQSCSEYCITGRLTRCFQKTAELTL